MEVRVNGGRSVQMASGNAELQRGRADISELTVQVPGTRQVDAMHGRGIKGEPADGHALRGMQVIGEQGSAQEGQG